MSSSADYPAVGGLPRSPILDQQTSRKWHTQWEKGPSYTMPRRQSLQVCQMTQKLTTKVDVFSYGKVTCELVVREMQVASR